MTSLTICFESRYRAHFYQLGKRLTAIRKGVADEELAKKEAERGRKRKVEEGGNVNGSWKHYRSISSSFSTSVSTISTNLSRSPTPKRSSRHDAGGYNDPHKYSQALFSQDAAQKRRRSSSMSTTSYTSQSFSSDERRHRHHSKDADRPKRLSTSPDARMREQNSNGRTNEPRGMTRKRRRSSSGSSSSYTSDSSHEGRRRDILRGEHRNTRRRRSSISPETRGRDREYDRRASRRTGSRSNSRDRSQVARNRQSMTPGTTSNGPRRDRNRTGHGNKDHQPLKDRDRRVSNDDDRYGSSFRNKNHDDCRRTKPLQSPLPRKDKSLSPFSKRLALTQAMNMGR